MDKYLVGSFAALWILVYYGIIVYIAVWLFRTINRIVLVQEQTLACLKTIERKLDSGTK